MCGTGAARWLLSNRQRAKPNAAGVVVLQRAGMQQARPRAVGVVVLQLAGAQVHQAALAADDVPLPPLPRTRTIKPANARGSHASFIARDDAALAMGGTSAWAAAAKTGNAKGLGGGGGWD